MDDFGMFNIPVINLDHYGVLGLKRENDPTIEDIRAAYQHLALQWHPERNKATIKRETASLKFIEINEAYKALMDKKLREEKEAAKAGKLKFWKDERTKSPDTDLTSPSGRSKSRPRWSASRIMSPPLFTSTSSETASTIESSKMSSEKEPHSEAESSSTIAPSIVPPPRSTIASPVSTIFTSISQLAPNPLYEGSQISSSSRRSREPSPAGTRVRGGGSESASSITTTRVNPEEPRASSFNTARSPPVAHAHDQDVRLPRYLRTMSDITSEFGSERSSSYTNGGYSPSVAASTSTTTSTIPDDWLFPVYLTLEDLFTCKTHRFRINRHLLNGTSKEVFVDVSVQPNWRDGTQLRCKGLGNEREGLPPQDVIFIVKEKLHSRFLRDPVGYDIYARLEISLVIALGGGSAKDEALLIKGVDGREIVVEIPPPVVRHGSMTRIRGAGMPKYKTKDGSVPLRGDLILEWCVLPPDKYLSEEAVVELRGALGDSWLRDEEEEARLAQM